MRDLSVVLRHAGAGGAVRFVMNYHGEQFVEFRTGLLRRKVRIRLSEQEVADLKASLRHRARASA